MKKDFYKKAMGMISNHVFAVVLCVGAVLILLSSFSRFAPINLAGEAKTEISSMLIDSIDISELSTAEFKYRGIAEIYSDEERKQIRCRLCYDAVVKAGIDMKQVKFEVDQEKKIITAILPEIELKVTIIDDKSIALLPSNADVGIDVMLKYSKEDAENEARQSTELMKTAEENLKTTIEGLLYPFMKDQGYALEWK